MPSTRSRAGIHRAHVDTSGESLEQRPRAASRSRRDGDRRQRGRLNT